MGVNIQIDVRDNGKLMVHGTYAQYALEISPDGKAAARIVDVLRASVQTPSGPEIPEVQAV